MRSRLSYREKVLLFPLFKFAYTKLCRLIPRTGPCINQAVADYRRLGYSEAWINQRIKTIEIRKGLTDEWKRGGVTKEVDFAFLTDLRKPQLKSANNAIRKGYLKMPVSPYPITRRTYLSRIPKNNNETGRSKAVCFVIF